VFPVSVDLSWPQIHGSWRVKARFPSIRYNTGVKPQFSLATLLVCVTVFAIVAAVCVTYSIPVYYYDTMHRE
jgi:hypothetical protein